MGKTTDIRPKEIALYFIPIKARVPLKFGKETFSFGTVARVRMRVEDSSGASAEGWGESPLGVGWTWPSGLSYEVRQDAMKAFCVRLASSWKDFRELGHPMETGHRFQESVLPDVLREFNLSRKTDEPMPWLSALVCCSPFDIALHDAFGVQHQMPVYEAYNARYMNEDLSHFITPAPGSDADFAGCYPEDFFVKPIKRQLPAWHLVGGVDPLSPSELTGSEPDDGYPVLLTDWIERDGLKCLKIKLRGSDMSWDYERIVQVGEIGLGNGVLWLTADFNCTVEDPSYVNDILDRLMLEYPRLYGMLLYVEQPFAYDLESNQIDVHSVAARKPLFMDESAHNWRLVQLGRELGWTGVALKTCKTQTGALLSLAWAKAHGMTLMVQDLTNPMLAQIPHVLLAAHAGTIMGVETNAPQFYPEASRPEAAVHPGLYRRRNGTVDLATLEGPGFGYGVSRIKRDLPEPVFC